MRYTQQLIDLGLDDRLQSNINETLLSSFTLSRVTHVYKNNYIVHTGTEEVFAELTGRFLYASDSAADLPAVGDWVYVQLYDNNTLAIIHELVPRKSVIKRKTSGKKIDYQIIAANIDTAVIMQALDNDFNINRLERYLVITAETNITPLLLLSKSDLLSPESAAEKMEAVRSAYPGITMIAFSNISKDDTDSLKEVFIPGKTYCLLGSSGVGKTTLLKNLTEDENLKTGPVRAKDGKGKHTTTNREMIFLQNKAMIIDNPGMRELGVMGAEGGLVTTFGEIDNLASNCKYQDCTHTVENGCAVIEAVESGTYPKERYDNYLKLLKEMQYNEMSYLEKRQKDKQFGKMLHHYLKQKGDK